jgi:hypothetical protein
VDVRVNLGGPSYTDHQGNTWERDKPYHRGSWGCVNMPETDLLSTTDSIADTRDPTLFQTVRVGEELRYRFDLPNGNYQVGILFAEIYWESRDAELQAVYVQGKRVLDGYSIYDDVGHDAAREQIFSARVTKGFLEVRLTGLSLPMHSGARACAIRVRVL